MSEVTIRDLRNHGGDVVKRVVRGESLILTRDGEPVAELRPLPRPGLSAENLLKRWRFLPEVDAVLLRRDIDKIVDPAL
jgi:prevent-host-death family protein